MFPLFCLVQLTVSTIFPNISPQTVRSSRSAGSSSGDKITPSKRFLRYLWTKRVDDHLDLCHCGSICLPPATVMMFGFYNVVVQYMWLTHTPQWHHHKVLITSCQLSGVCLDCKTLTRSDSCFRQDKNYLCHVPLLPHTHTRTHIEHNHHPRWPCPVTSTIFLVSFVPVEHIRFSKQRCKTTWWQPSL